MAFGTGPGVESPSHASCFPQTGAHEVAEATEPAMEESMNPLDSITGTIVSGIILSLILVALV